MSENSITISILGPEDASVLDATLEDVFDHAIRADQAQAFLANPLNVMVVAQDGPRIIGFASGHLLHHPDKLPAFFVAELSVHDDYRRRGIAKDMMARLTARADEMGAHGIWVATEEDNLAARATYKSLAARETRDIVVYDWGDPEFEV